MGLRDATLNSESPGGRTLPTYATADDRRTTEMRLPSLPELLGIPKEEGFAGRRSLVQVTGHGGETQVGDHRDLGDTRTVVAASRGCSLRVGAQP